MKIIIEDDQVKKEHTYNFVTKNAEDAGSSPHLGSITDIGVSSEILTSAFKSSSAAIDAGPPSPSLIKNVQEMKESMTWIVNKDDADAGAAPEL